MVYRSNLVKRDELDVQRVEFVKFMLEFIIRDEPYVYFDEMAMHSFVYKTKAWSYASEPVLVPINSGNRLKVSVYGAIGNVFKYPVLMYRY